MDRTSAIDFLRGSVCLEIVRELILKGNEDESERCLKAQFASYLTMLPPFLRPATQILVTFRLCRLSVKESPKRRRTIQRLRDSSRPMPSVGYVSSSR